MITIFAGAVLAVAVRYMQPLPKGFEQSVTREREGWRWKRNTGAISRSSM